MPQRCNRSRAAIRRSPANATISDPRTRELAVSECGGCVIALNKRLPKLESHFPSHRQDEQDNQGAKWKSVRYVSAARAAKRPAAFPQRKMTQIARLVVWLQRSGWSAIGTGADSRKRVQVKTAAQRPLLNR